MEKKKMLISQKELLLPQKKKKKTFLPKQVFQGLMVLLLSECFRKQRVLEGRKDIL